MDIITSVSSATNQSEMNSSPYETADHDQMIFKTPDNPNSIPCSSSACLVKNEGQLSTVHVSSPHSVNSPLSDPFISSTSNVNDGDFNVFSTSHEFSPFSSTSDSHNVISATSKHSMDQFLTCTGNNMVPRSSSPQDSLISSPVNKNDTILSTSDSNHEMESANPEYTLIDRAGRFNINDSDSHHFDAVRFDQGSDHGFEQLLDYVVTDGDSHKVPKVRPDSDAPSSINKEEVTVDKLFEANLANSTAEFSFSKFGSEVSQGIFTFGQKNSTGAETTSTNATFVVTSAVPTPICEIVKTSVTPVTRSQRGGRHQKEPSLCQQYPSKTDKYELRILEQPEEQHRARYLTEGSRGAIKNVSQEGNPVIKLLGDVDHASLQVFIGNDQGRVKPHAFYQACKVCGKNSTPCQEREIDGTVVIEMDLDMVNDKTCSIDNVGILKLRNADVENRVGIQKAKKKSTKARLIFRVQFQKPDGNIQILQVASRSINCTQPIGQPEICKMSLRETTVEGNVELIMIGKNFMKGTKVFFQETNGEDGPVVWEKESEIDKDYFQPTHLVCNVPCYRDTNITNKVNIQVVVRCSGKQSEPQAFTYTPVLQIKQETPMETDEQQQEVPKPGPMNITVAPEALRLNQQLQESLASSPGKFMLPHGTVSGITSMQVDMENNPGEKSLTESSNAEQLQAASQETKSHVEENGNGSLSKDNIETIEINSSDLHSILNSLDDKPMSLQEIFTSTSSEQFRQNNGHLPVHDQQQYTEGTSIGQTSASFPATSQHQTPQLTIATSGFSQCSPGDVHSPHPQVHTPVYNSLAGGFENTSTYGGQNLQEMGYEQNNKVFSPNVPTFQPAAVENPTEFATSPQPFQQVVNSPQTQQDYSNNPTSVQGYTTEMSNVQSHQQTVANIQNQQQNLGKCVEEFPSNFNSSQGTHGLENIQTSNQHLQCFQGNSVLTVNTNNMSFQNNATVQGFPSIQAHQEIPISPNLSVHATNNEAYVNSQNITGNLHGQQKLSSFPIVVSSIQTPQCSIPRGEEKHGLSAMTTSNTPFSGGHIIQGFGNGQNSQPVSTTANSSQQSGYSDVAMKLLQQLLVKSSNSEIASTNQFDNISQNTKLLNSGSAIVQQPTSMGLQTSLTPLSLPTTVLQQQISVTSPSQKVSSGQGILHQMLSQELDKPSIPFSPVANTNNTVGGKPAVQRLDSLRLQAMAQQVQQQAQTSQQATTNGNSPKGPQIIVLGGNNGGDQQTSSSGGGAAPSILILPGGNGDNNNPTTNPQSQVEYILRSILGSLKTDSK